MITPSAFQAVYRVKKAPMDILDSVLPALLERYPLLQELTAMNASMITSMA